MNGLKLVMLSAVAGCCLLAGAPRAIAHGQISVQIGTAPECPYGYYDSSPYRCAPYGYYGPEWFSGGMFVGAGPWFHGQEGFRGHVNNRYHVDNGYRGRLPERGEKARSNYRPEANRHFRGNEVRDGHGHAEGNNRDHDKH
jgi:hypothetical protein